MRESRFPVERLRFFLLSFALIWSPLLSQTNGPELITLRTDVYRLAKERLATGDETLQLNLARLLAHADRALTTQPPSVMDKARSLPGGDKHDFLCPAPLWWPDPEQEDGLPYIWNREGKINPEYINTGDQAAFDRLTESVQSLAFAYYFTGEEKYARKAVMFVRAWFLHPDTRMNPNLKHAWFERGRNTGTAFGIRATERLPLLLDAITLLQPSHFWDSEDRAAFKTWVAEFLDWLRNSELGAEAGRIWNRFGTIYDVQVAACALFLEQPEIAREVIESAKVERIDRHIRRDGRQPYALEREITFSNSVGSIGYLFQLATLGEKVDVDLWHHLGREGASIRKALDFVAPYADSARVWPYILEVERKLLNPILAQAALVYDDDEYIRLLNLLPDPAGVADIIYAFYRAAHHPATLADEPRLHAHHLNVLQEAKTQLAANSTTYQHELDLLLEIGHEALQLPLNSVMDKSLTPPSGDKHDFMSVGGYYWPDTTKADGLPWIYRDGIVNPNRSEYGDWDRFYAMNLAVQQLGLAYFFTGDERYARHAVRLLQVWFLDSSTRMNPNLRYSHAQPGVFDGSYYGIIQTRELPAVFDAIGLIAPSASWTENDHLGMKQWAAAFLDWMLHDEEAEEASRVWNNHSVNYDATAVALALFAGRKGTARRILEENTKLRIHRQIRADGRMPFELERNRPMVYAGANLHRFLSLAVMAEHVGVDLWQYEALGGGSLLKAVNYLGKYADPRIEWPYPDLNFDKDGDSARAWVRPILQLAFLAYNQPKHREWLTRIPANTAFIRQRYVYHLFYPK
ncbi:alginate lyase family protein [bacterium]|nr:alginate lyase family protein [bacterium]